MDKNTQDPFFVYIKSGRSILMCHAKKRKVNFFS